jgi:hypothetical protein
MTTHPVTDYMTPPVHSVEVTVTTAMLCTFLPRIASCLTQLVKISRNKWPTCHHSMARPWIAGGVTESRYRGQLRIYWISSRGQPTKGFPPPWESGEVITTPQCKSLRYYGKFHKVSDLDWLFGPTQTVYKNTRFGNCNMRSLYRARSVWQWPGD